MEEYLRLPGSYTNYCSRALRFVVQRRTPSIGGPPCVLVACCALCSFLRCQARAQPSAGVVQVASRHAFVTCALCSAPHLRGSCVRMHSHCGAGKRSGAPHLQALAGVTHGCTPLDDLAASHSQGCATGGRSWIAAVGPTWVATDAVMELSRELCRFVYSTVRDNKQLRSCGAPKVPNPASPTLRHPTHPPLPPPGA